MLDNMTKKQQTKTSSPDQKLQEQFSVDTFVEKSIDELFQDVDKVLEGGARLPTESVKPEFLSLKPIKVPQLVLPQRMPTPEELAKQREEEAKAAALAQLKSKQESQSAEKILLGAAFASLVISLSLLLATKGGIQEVVKYFSPTAPEVETPNPKLEADVKFADYLERSLELLDKQPKTTGTNSPTTMPAVPIPPPPSELPKVPVNASPTQNLSSLLLPLNRIADLIEAQAARPPLTIPPTQVVVIPPSPQPIPVVVNYNPPPAPAPAPAPVAKAQPAPKPAETKAQGQPVTQPSPAAKAQAPPEAKPSPAAKARSQPETKPSPVAKARSQPETKPSPVAKAQAQPETKPSPVATNETVEVKAETQPEAKKTEPQVQLPPLEPLPPPPPVMVSETVTLRTIPNYTHTLVGVLELGDRSAALFEINGVARRVYVGESVGASGWMLVKVAEGEATMRRNGEIRSVFVGEQF
jgi:hypothetical protein